MMRWRSGAFAFEPRGLPCLNHSGPRGATATESAHDDGAAFPALSPERPTAHLPLNGPGSNPLNDILLHQQEENNDWHDPKYQSR